MKVWAAEPYLPETTVKGLLTTTYWEACSLQVALTGVAVISHWEPLSVATLSLGTSALVAPARFPAHTQLGKTVGWCRAEAQGSPSSWVTGPVGSHCPPLSEPSSPGCADTVVLIYGPSHCPGPSTDIKIPAGPLW